MSARANACTHIAADLLRAVLSDIPEDWPKSMPRVALRAIATQEDALKDCAYRVRYAGNCLGELDRECAALRARVEELEAGLREALEVASSDREQMLMREPIAAWADHFRTLLESKP